MTAPVRARPCSLYRITVWNPHDDYRSKWRGYIGETERLPIERIAEHLRAQYPWGDTVAAIEVDDRVWPGKASVVRAERAAVEDEQPLYNVEWNGGNPYAIPYEAQVAQRWARDDAAGRPRWQQGRRPGRAARLTRVAARRARRAPPWLLRLGRRLEPAAPWAAVWLVLAVAAGLWLWREVGLTDLGSAAGFASGLATIGLGLVMPGRRRRRRGKYRRW